MESLNNIYFLLILFFTCLTEKYDCGSFVPIGKQDTTRKIDELKNDLIDLKKQVNLNNSSSLYFRIDDVESNIDNIRRSLDDLQKSTTQTTNQKDDLLKNITSFYNSLKYQVEEINRVMLKEREEQKINKLPAKCADEIMSRDYMSALHTLSLIDNDYKINTVVHLAYNGRISNFHNVLAFSQKMNDPIRRFMIIKSLAEEVQNNDHMNARKLVSMMKDLKYLHQVMKNNPGDDMTSRNQIYRKSYYMHNMEQLFEKLKDELKIYGRREVKAQALSDDYSPQLLNDIMECDMDVGVFVMNNVISDISDNMEKSTMFLYKHYL